MEKNQKPARPTKSLSKAVSQSLNASVNKSISRSVSSDQYQAVNLSVNQCRNGSVSQSVSHQKWVNKWINLSVIQSVIYSDRCICFSIPLVCSAPDLCAPNKNWMSMKLTRRVLGHLLLRSLAPHCVLSTLYMGVDPQLWGVKKWILEIDAETDIIG